MSGTTELDGVWVHLLGCPDWTWWVKTIESRFWIVSWGWAFFFWLGRYVELLQENRFSVLCLIIYFWLLIRWVELVCVIVSQNWRIHSSKEFRIFVSSSQSIWTPGHIKLYGHSPTRLTRWYKPYGGTSGRPSPLLICAVVLPLV